MTSWDIKLYQENSRFYLMEFRLRMSEGKEVALMIQQALKKKFSNRFKQKRINILDIPCGIGRISLPLAQLGYTVTGIDYSEIFLEEAVKFKNSNPDKINPSFINADMHNLDAIINTGKKFDLIVNYWTSFGYGTREDDLNFFTSLRKLTHPTSVLLIETWHRENIVTFPIPKTFYETAETLNLVYNDISPEEDYVKSRHVVYLKDENNLSKITEFTSSIRLYSTNELKGLLQESGWKIIAKNNTLMDFLNDAKFSALQDRIVIFAEPF